MIRKARKGITPVVAIVLLLMMTVAVAGGAYAWMQGIIGGTQEEATRAANTQLAFRGLDCQKVVTPSGSANTTEIDFTLKNSGSTTLQREDVDVFLYPRASSSLLGTDQLSNSNPFEDGALWTDTSNVSMSTDAERGDSLTVRFEFTNENSFPVEDSCQLQ